MERFSRIAGQVIFFLHVLLFFLLLVEDRIHLPAWIEVIGRLHPAVVHLPIGLLVFVAFLQFTRSWWTDAGVEKVVHLLVICTSLVAVLSALMGLFLSHQSSYGEDDLSLHKFGGVILSVLCYIQLLVSDRIQSEKMWGFSSALVLLATVVFTGHTGSVLTHGRNFVLEPLMPKDEMAVSGTVYGDVVQPILSKKCFSCHNASKAKGGLVMTDVERFKAGGEGGPEWDPLNPSASRLVKYIHLPEKDDDHMPPEGKPQLTALEMKILTSWIQSGASFESTVADLPAGDTMKIIAAGHKPERSGAVVYDFEAAPASEIERLNTPFRTVALLYRDGPALRVDYFVKERYAKGSLAELKSIAQQVVELNLAHMPVSDDELPSLALFENLEILNLNFTLVTSIGLEQILTLKKLKSLSVNGTNTNAEAVRKLLTLPSLSRIYIGNTGIQKPEEDALRKEFGHVSIFGTEEAGAVTMQLGMPSLSTEEVLQVGQPLTLKHTMPGVAIRYTVDGSTPDSIRGEIYSKPLILQRTTRIRAVACKPGWKCSPMLDRVCFVKGIASTGVLLLTRPDPGYPAEGAESLTDLRKGFADVFKEPSWMGFRKGDMKAEFHFDGKQVIGEVVISFGFNTGSHMFPAEKAEISGDVDGSLKLLAQVRPAQPAKDEPSHVDFLAVPVPAKAYRKILVHITPVGKLPEWKSKKRDPGWFFTDEIFFY